MSHIMFILSVQSRIMLTPTLIDGYVSDLAECQSAFISSNYINVTSMNKSDYVNRTLFTGQSSKMYVGCYENYMGYTYGQEGKIFYHAHFFENYTEKEEQYEEEYIMDVEYKLKAQNGDKISFFKNILVLKSLNQVKINQVQFVQKQRIIEAVSIKNFVGKLQYQFYQKGDVTFMVYSQNNILTIYDLAQNKSVFEQTFEDIQILEIKSESASNYVITKQKMDFISYEITISKEGAFGLKQKASLKVSSILDKLGLVLANIPLDQLLKYNRVKLYGEDYIVFYSPYNKPFLARGMLLLYSIKASPIERPVQIYLSSKTPISVYSNSMNKLYLFGQVGIGNAQTGFIDLDGLLKAPTVLEDTTKSCWAIKEKVKVVQHLNQTLEVSLADKTKCDPAPVQMLFKDYFQESKMIFDGHTYKIDRYSSIQQLGYDIIANNLVNVNSQKMLISKSILSYVDGPTSCYNNAQVVILSLSENRLSLGVSISEAELAVCAMDQPDIQVFFTYNEQKITKVLEQQSQTNPLNGSTYGVLFDPDTMPSLNGEIEMILQVTSYSPSGYVFSAVNITKKVKTSIANCFSLSEYVKITYSGSATQVQLQDLFPNKFARPCYKDFNFGQFDLAYTFHDVNYKYKKQDLQLVNGIPSKYQDLDLNLFNFTAANLNTGAFQMDLYQGLIKLQKCPELDGVVYVYVLNNKVTLNWEQTSKCAYVNISKDIPAQNVSIVDSKGKARCSFVSTGDYTYESQCSVSQYEQFKFIYLIDDKQQTKTRNIQIVNLDHNKSIWLTYLLAIVCPISSLYLIATIVYLIISFKQKGYVYTAIPSETEPVVETEEIKTDFLNEFQEAPKTKENDKKKKKQKSKEIDEMLPTIPAPKKK
ncbi:Conserved_hypothetical protein [Hexamita inflata]|uniref:Transmembrane protein n=1 Tax=Hexamita inflata TaxID=28002 RepID=A0AA86UK68_9EUKA|nr:Conserved hypothetical protein [Hexamita inflata]